ncbi:uncharacterized, partial [Tachysurus ichikawai]
KLSPNTDPNSAPMQNLTQPQHRPKLSPSTDPNSAIAQTLTQP